MKDFITSIVTQIVDHPDEVSVTENIDSQGTVLLTLRVADEDMGKVIGKGGKIIRSLRFLLKVKAIRSDQHVRLELAEPESPVPEE